jgi:hypothetical protein
MVVLPSPYAYAWFEAPAKQFNLEVKVGCKDPNSVDYCEDCQVEDNSRCGPCNAGWTKTNDPNQKCWAVGSMTVDCANNKIFYHPMGCVSAERTGYTGGNNDCTCGGVDNTNGCGQQITKRIGKKQVTSSAPTVKYKPAYGKPGYVKSYAGNYSYNRTLWAVVSDGTPVFLKGSGKWIKSTEDSGALIKEKVYDIIKSNCGGTVTRVELTEADRKTIPPLLGVNSAVDSPAVTSTATTPDSGISNTPILDDSSVDSPVTSYDDETEDSDISISSLVWPIAGVIGLLGFMKLRGGK